MDGLDEFSRSFADALFVAIPELRGQARAENGLLLIERAPGPGRLNCEFWVSTEAEEVTVGFGYFHTHFDWPEFGGYPENDPIKFIVSLMADEVLIEDWELDGKWVGSTTLGATEEPDLHAMQPGHVVFIRSWSGAHDRTIRGG